MAWMLTPYEDVNVVLGRLLAGVQRVLEQRFVGLYVFGSVAESTFDPQRSDIDFLVATDGQLPDEMHPALAAMHARITASDLVLADRLEGSYIPQAALRRYDPDNARHPALRMDGSFDVDHHGSDWIIQRHVIREGSMVMAGPDARTLIDPVSPVQLRWAAQATLREWWAPQLGDHSRLLSSEYQAYAVLTMCRALYTIQSGTVTSKPLAARWAQERLDDRWSPLIE